ncbi:potassium channel subfamily K member 1-like [Eriocheir sinensis]|uniref:potassium channel subfamily K member 1-like n=1 Tax=Eriocheir sinensis TaxID=95602 RepID=UPI0021C7ED91|nr:potassium channel subfamily K member 1-like [Eriocheir sinensis]
MEPIAPFFHTHRQAAASKELRAYEAAIEDAMGAGVSVLAPSVPAYDWLYPECVFFASTIITTIGYGNQAPVTLPGRVFCILYGFVGIPLTLSVIQALGTFFANGASSVYQRLRRVVTCTPLESLKKKGSRGAAVVGAVGALLVYLAVGGAFFTLWEEDWTFFEGFYFCFITMTTIGLGDLVPGEYVRT